jgi:hypothetical protein
MGTATGMRAIGARVTAGIDARDRIDEERRARGIIDKADVNMVQ